MSWLKTTILIAGLLWAKLAYCEIHEIKNMAAIVPAIQDDTLLVFDIDNTLIEPVGNLGSDQWFYYLYKIYKINGFDEKTTQQQALRAWNQAQSLISVRAAEASIPDLIQSQQKKGLKMLALTARSVEIADREHHVADLEAVGVLEVERTQVLRVLQLQDGDVGLLVGGEDARVILALIGKNDFNLST